MPVAVLKIGRMYPNRPESCVDVVELRVTNRSSARAALIAKITNRKVTIRLIGDSRGTGSVHIGIERKCLPRVINCPDAKSEAWQKQARSGHPIPRSPSCPLALSAIDGRV